MTTNSSVPADPQPGNVHNYCAMCGGYSGKCEIANIDVLYRVEFTCVQCGDTWRMWMNDQLFAAALTDILLKRRFCLAAVSATAPVVKLRG